MKGIERSLYNIVIMANTVKHLHVICRDGSKAVISWAELMAENEASDTPKYTIDMDWYSEANGYITSKDLINKLQSQNE